MILADTTTLTLTQTYIEHLVPGAYANRISFSGQSITLLPHLGGTGAVFAGNAGATSFALAAIRTASINSRYGAAFSQLRISSALYPASTSTPATVFTVFDTPGNSDISDNTTRLALFNGTDGKVLLVPTGASKVGVGLAFADTPASKMHILDTTAGSLSSVVNTVTIGRNTSDTPIAAGFGVGIAFQLQSSSAPNQDAGRIRYEWASSTHATRTSKAVISAVLNGTDTDVLTVAALSGGNRVTIANGNLVLANGYAMEFVAGSGTYINSVVGTYLRLVTGNVVRQEFDASGNVIFNDTGADTDFRIEGDTNANLFMLDAGLDAIGIGETASSGSRMNVNGTLRADGLRLDVSPTLETIVCTHTITVDINGTNYKIPIVVA